MVTSLDCTYYTKLIMVCQFVKISPKDLYTTICIDETVSLIDKFDKNVILTETGIIPQIQSSVDYRISTSHLNNILKQHLLLKKKSMYVTKWCKQSPKYWPQQLCWVARTFTKQEKEEKFQIVYLKWCICLYTNIMELYFQLKHVSSNFETRYIHVWKTYIHVQLYMKMTKSIWTFEFNKCWWQPMFHWPSFTLGDPDFLRVSKISYNCVQVQPSAGGCVQI